MTNCQSIFFVNWQNCLLNVLIRLDWKVKEIKWNWLNPSVEQITNWQNEWMNDLHIEMYLLCRCWSIDRLVKCPFTIIYHSESLCVYFVLFCSSQCDDEHTKTSSQFCLKTNSKINTIWPYILGVGDTRLKHSEGGNLSTRLPIRLWV